MVRIRGVVHPEGNHAIEMDIGRINAEKVQKLVKAIEKELEVERVGYLKS